MKYEQPAGKAEGAPYVDGDRNAGLLGDIPPAAAIEHAQRELVHLIEFAGGTPSAVDLQQVRKAIQTLIAAATGGGDTSQFVTMAQARGRLRDFPHVLNSTGKVGVTIQGTGQIRVPASVDILHRGIFPLTTSQEDFATAAGKTYHLRKNLNSGAVALKDLADGAYNPAALPENNVAFDSTFDDMLIARVVTDVSNVPSVTNLANRAKGELVASFTKSSIDAGASWGAMSRLAGVLEWARTPNFFSIGNSSVEYGPGAESDVYRQSSGDRYACDGFVAGINWGSGGPYISGSLTLHVRAA